MAFNPFIDNNNMRRTLRRVQSVVHINALKDYFPADIATVIAQLAEDDYELPKWEPPTHERVELGLILGFGTLLLSLVLFYQLPDPVIQFVGRCVRL